VIQCWRQYICRSVFNTAVYVEYICRRVRKIAKSDYWLRPSVRLSIYPHGTIGSHLRDFHEIWYLRIFRKSDEKIQVSLNSYQNKEYFTGRPIYIVDHISLILTMKSISDKISEKLETHILCSVTFFFFENRSVYEIMWKKKSIVARGRPRDKRAHAHYMLYPHIHFLYTATMVARKCLLVTLYVHCLSCLNYDETELRKISLLLEIIFWAVRKKIFS
jgi:hypothetical protein